MCGIVGYVGKNNGTPYILDGLESLEYRGYDSAGLSQLQKGRINTTKVVGRVEALRKELEKASLEDSIPTWLDASHSELEPISPYSREAQASRTSGTMQRASQVSKAEGAEKTVVSQASPESRQSGSVCEVGIGHTRWATHGSVLHKNAHPHHDKSGEFSVIHNGIIENYQDIKKFLEPKGYKFYSDTDTEVIPNLVHYHFQKLGDVEQAFIATIDALRGAYGIVMITTNQPDTIYCAKLSSPLAIGVGKGEMFIGSDAIPMAPHTQEVVFLQDNDIAIVTQGGYRVIDGNTKERLHRPSEHIELESSTSDTGEYPDFMSKEMHEAPQTVRSAMLGRLRVEENLVKLGGLELVQTQLQFIDRIVILACGTSLYAGMVGEYLIEEIAGIPVEIQQASEFRYRSEPLSRSTAVLVVSQSGETADVIAALKKLEGTGILKLGVINSTGSTLSRLTDAGVYCHAGQEKAVASTKAFIAQVTVLLLIALSLSKNYPEYSTLLHALDDLPKQIEKVLENEEQIAKIARKYSHHPNFLCIGRRYAYPVALEGALKLKEISYIHAEGFAGGEMKHGPLALIDKNFPTFALALTNDVAEKSLSNMQEIKARGGPLVAIVDDAKSEAAKLADDFIVIPKVPEQLQPILSAVVTHLFAYHTAKDLGRDIDKPRNLAKSVTVE